MSSTLSGKQIGKRIAESRKRKGFSQQDIAVFLGIQRSSVAQMELGNRNVSLLEFIKLSEVLGFSLDKFLSTEYGISGSVDVVAEPTLKTQELRISIPKLKVEKFRNVLLYMLEKCAGKANVGETVLYKLLYFSDFNFYEVYEQHLTGAEYRKLPFGPVPQKLDGLIADMLKKEQLQRVKTKFHGYPQTRFIPLCKPDLTQMSAAEKDVIDKVIDRFSDWSAAAISDFSHLDMPWKATKDGDLIDYELAFYRETPFSARTYEHEVELP